MRFQGIVQKGFGTGAYYVQIPHYFLAFTNLLKAPPYPGTLNVLFSEESYEKLRSLLKRIPPLTISGKEDEKNGIWRIECYYCELWTDIDENKVNCLILRFSRPHHQKEIIEFVSSVHLREKFDLKDGDFIQFQLKNK